MRTMVVLLALTLLAGCAVVPVGPYDAFDGPYYYSAPAHVYYEYGYHRPWHRSYYGHGYYRPRFDGRGGGRYYRR